MTTHLTKETNRLTVPEAESYIHARVAEMAPTEDLPEDLDTVIVSRLQGNSGQFTSFDKDALDDLEDRTLVGVYNAHEGRAADAIDTAINYVGNQGVFTKENAAMVNLFREDMLAGHEFFTQYESTHNKTLLDDEDFENTENIDFSKVSFSNDDEVSLEDALSFLDNDDSLSR